MEIEREIHELVRQESVRDAADKEREVFVNSVCDTIQGVAGTSVAKIDRLIDELTQLREHLQNEGNRVQSEIARVQSEIDGYTVNSEVAVQSLNAIDQSLGQFKRAVGPSKTLLTAITSVQRGDQARHRAIGDHGPAPAAPASSAAEQWPLWQAGGDRRGTVAGFFDG